MTTRSKCCSLASRLGCEIEYTRNHWNGGGAQQVDILLPAGMEFDGNPGLNALHHECGLDEDIWPGVFADLQVIAGT
jgi:hypothetical protein